MVYGSVTEYLDGSLCPACGAACLFLVFHAGSRLPLRWCDRCSAIVFFAFPAAVDPAGPWR